MQCCPQRVRSAWIGEGCCRGLAWPSEAIDEGTTQLASHGPPGLCCLDLATASSLET